MPGDYFLPFCKKCPLSAENSGEFSIAQGAFYAIKLFSNAESVNT